MRTLVAADVQQFLNDNGYDWTGFIALNRGHKSEICFKCGKWRIDFNNCYILLGQDDGLINVRGNNFIRYIKQDDVTFVIYKRLQDGRLQKEKDLSDNWVEFQTNLIPGYAESILTRCQRIQSNHHVKVQDRKNLLAKDIERLTREANQSIEAMGAEVNKSKHIEQVIYKSKSDLQV